MCSCVRVIQITLGARMVIARRCRFCKSPIDVEATVCWRCRRDQRPVWKRPWPVVAGVIGAGGALAVILGVLLPLWPTSARLTYEVHPWGPGQAFARTTQDGEQVVLVREYHAGLRGGFPPFELAGPDLALVDSIAARRPLTAEIWQVCIVNGSSMPSDSLHMTVNVPGWLYGVVALDVTEGRSRAKYSSTPGHRISDSGWEWHRQGLPGKTHVVVDVLFFPPPAYSTEEQDQIDHLFRYKTIGTLGLPLLRLYEGPGPAARAVKIEPGLWLDFCLFPEGL